MNNGGKHVFLILVCEKTKYKIRSISITIILYSTSDVRNLMILYFWCRCSTVFRLIFMMNQQVRLADWSKAPDLSSGTHMCAWVRTPHLTSNIFVELCKDHFQRFNLLELNCKQCHCVKLNLNEQTWKNRTFWSMHIIIRKRWLLFTNFFDLSYDQHDWFNCYLLILLWSSFKEPKSEPVKYLNDWNDTDSHS